MDAVVVAAAMAAAVVLPVCSSSIFKSRLLHKDNPLISPAIFDILVDLGSLWRQRKFPLNEGWPCSV